MTDPHRGFELAERQLERDVADGRISQDDFNEAMRDLGAEYREAARDAADEAYRNELERW